MPEEKKDVTNLSPEEADELLAQENADPEGEEAEKPEEAKKEAGEEATPDPKEQKKEDGEGGEKEQPEKDARPESEEEDKTGDRLKDTQRAFHERSRKLKEAELENERLKAELEAMKAKTGERKYEDGLTREELEELQYEDPEKWRKVMNAREAADSERDQAVHRSEEMTQEIVSKRQLLNTLEFAANALGLDLSQVENPYDPSQLPEKMVQYLRSPEFQRLEAEVTENFRPGENGIYTAAQLEKAHRLVNWENFAAEQRQKGAEISLMAIRKAAETGHKLDSAPKGDGAKGMKPIEALTQEDIEAMGAGELESYYKLLEEQEE